MKKFIKLKCLFIALTLLSVFLVSCAGGAGNELQNQVAPAELSPDAWEIATLLSDTHNTSIFDFHIEYHFTTVTMWLDTYEYGELIESEAVNEVISFPTPDFEGDPPNGRIAIMRHQDTYTNNWEFVLRRGGGVTARNSIETHRAFTGMSTWATLVDTIDIESGNDIVLLIHTFGSGMSMHGQDIQSILSQPSYIKHFPIAHVVRVQFS